MNNELRDPKVLLYDIETSPLISYNWGIYEQNAIEVIKHPQMLCFAFKWLGDRKVKAVGQDDLPGYKPGVNDDKRLVKELWKLFNSADVVIGHNSNSFDNKFSHSRMMVHKLNPPMPYKQIDTKLVAKKYARFASNKLNDLGKELGIGEKLKHEGFDLWTGVMSGRQGSWNTMKAYNKKDVELLEKLYLYLRPWIDNHPSMGLLSNQDDVCPKCMSYNMQKSGIYINKTGKKQRYKCLDCGGYSLGRFIHQTEIQFTN